MKWSRISNLLNLVIYRLHPFRGSNINFFVCTQSEWFWIDEPSNKIGEKTLPQLPNKKTMWNVYSSIRTLLWRRCTGICFKFLNYDHDGPVFIIGNTETDAELVSGKYTSCVRLRVWDSLKSRIVLFDGDKNYLNNKI